MLSYPFYALFTVRTNQDKKIAWYQSLKGFFSTISFIHNIHTRVFFFTIYTVWYILYIYHISKWSTLVLMDFLKIASRVYEEDQREVS